MPPGTSKTSQNSRPIKTLPKPAAWFSSSATTTDIFDSPMKGAGNKLGGIRSVSSRRFSIPDDDGEEDEGIGRLPPGKLGHARMISEAEDDFVMVSVSPNRTSGKPQRLAVDKPNTRQRSRSPVPCGMTIAAEKLSLVESANQLATSSTPFKPSQPPRLPQLELDSGFDSGTFDSPLRPLPGHSRSLRSRTNDNTSNDLIEEDDNPPLANRNAEPPRTAAKTFITRARSDSMRHEEGEGSSPDSVRQRQGSWIKRSKGPMPPFVDGSVPSPALGKFGQGSLFSPQRMGLSGKGRTKTNDSERSDLSSSPPPPDTPIQRSTGHQMRSSTGLSGIPQPRFTSVRRPSLGGQYATISGLPKSRSSGIGPTADADNSVFLSPASKAAASTWSSSKPIRPMDNTGRGLLSFKPERPRPHSGSALDRDAESETDREAERIFGSGKKAISMSELRHGQGGSALALGNNVNKENQSDLPVRPGRHRRTGSHHGNQLLFAKPADRSTIAGGSPFATVTNRPHRKTMSVENEHSSGMPRSFGLKAGLADTAQGPFPSALGGGYGLLPKSTSGSSRSSIDSAASTSNTNLTSITSATSLALEDPPFFDDVKPLQAAFEASDSQRVSRKFKGRDSISSNSSKDQTLGDVIGPNMTTRSSSNALFAPQPVRPGFLKRASSYANDGDKNALYAETPGLAPTDGSGWPSAFGFDFGAARESIGGSSNSGRMAKPSMPDTPMKKGSFDGTAAGKSLARVSHSVSQPVLATQPMFSSMKPPASGQTRTSMLPPPPKLNFKTAQQPIIKVHTTGHEMTDLPQVTITTGNLPLHARGVEADEDSPTIRLSGHFDKSLEGNSSVSTGNNQLAPGGAQGVRLGLLRRLSSGAASASSEMSEDENTPTKHNGGELAMLGTERPSLIRSTTPTPAPKFGSHDDSLLAPESRPAAPSALQAPSLHHVHSAPLASRQSLPQFTLSKPVRRLNHRQSAPGPVVDHDEDVFDKRFVSLEPLGKGAFSQVFKVKERSTDKLYAVKKARGVFEGVKDRLRHLEEVDILRHLSAQQHKNVITFIDAWEQNRQLYIQTELYLGTLAFFLEEYGSVVERLDEARAWKICREMTDGLEYIHSMGVIHFDIKPDNILIDGTGCLKISDFGMASRWPRISAEEILSGSGLGGEVGNASSSSRLADREGDRVYMAPEMLKGQFTSANDVFSFGLVVLEAATNICVPDGGPAWHAIREDDFSIIDFTYLSPALVDLITLCMRGEPNDRPTMAELAQHPILRRARSSGKDALSPEDELWLPAILANAVIPVQDAFDDSNEDVEMADV